MVVLLLVVVVNGGRNCSWDLCGGDQPLTTLSLSSSPIISVVFLWVICGLFLHLPTYNVNASQMNDQFMTDHNIIFLGIKKVN